MKGGLVLKGRIHWLYHFSFLSQLKARLSSVYQPTRSPEEERHFHITWHVLARRGCGVDRAEQWQQQRVLRVSDAAFMTTLHTWAKSHHRRTVIETHVHRLDRTHSTGRWGWWGRTQGWTRHPHSLSATQF